MPQMFDIFETYIISVLEPFGSWMPFCFWSCKSINLSDFSTLGNLCTSLMGKTLQVTSYCKLSWEYGSMGNIYIYITYTNTGNSQLIEYIILIHLQEHVLQEFHCKMNCFHPLVLMLTSLNLHIKVSKTEVISSSKF